MLHNISFGFKIFSLAESYQITYSPNTQIHNSDLALPSFILLPKTRAELKLFSLTLFIHTYSFPLLIFYILIQFSKDNIIHSFIIKYYILNIKKTWQIIHVYTPQYSLIIFLHWIYSFSL